MIKSSLLVTSCKVEVVLIAKKEDAEIHSLNFLNAASFDSKPKRKMEVNKEKEQLAIDLQIGNSPR